MKKNAKTNLRIIKLRDEFGLTRNQLRDYCMYSRNTIDAWLLPPGSAHHRKAPERAVRLLGLELGVVAPKWPALHPK